MRQRATSGLLAAATAAVGLAATGTAHALRCQSKVIAEGDRDVVVRKYCGEPTSVSTRYAQRALADVRGRIFYPGFREEVRIEEWTYNFGPHRLMRVIRLENGVVADIEQLGYGFNE